MASAIMFCEEVPQQDQMPSKASNELVVHRSSVDALPNGQRTLTEAEKAEESSKASKQGSNMLF